MVKIAVITPYYKESEELLRQCHDSVRAQTAACDHFMVADGFPNPVLDGWNVRHITLPMSHRDVGNSPRVIGALSAFSAGYDAVSFLDADNWYEPDHVATMLALHRRTGAVVCTAGRSMHRPDGSFMFVDDKNDGETHVDSNCYFLLRPAMGVMLRWATMPKELAPIGDTVYLKTIKRARLAHAHDPHVSVCYRSTWVSDFERIGEVPPPGAKTSSSPISPGAGSRACPGRSVGGSAASSDGRRVSRARSGVACARWRHNSRSGPRRRHSGVQPDLYRLQRLTTCC